MIHFDVGLCKARQTGAQYIRVIVVAHSCLGGKFDQRKSKMPSGGNLSFFTCHLELDDILAVTASQQKHPFLPQRCQPNDLYAPASKNP